MTVSVCVEFRELVIPQDEHLFYQLAGRALSVGFSCGDGGALLVRFVFPGIWERAV